MRLRLEEEQILRTFFSQKEVPASLLKYKDLFCYEQTETADDTLGDDFDARMMALVNEPEPVKGAHNQPDTKAHAAVQGGRSGGHLPHIGQRRAGGFHPTTASKSPPPRHTRQTQGGQSVAMGDNGQGGHREACPGHGQDNGIRNFSMLFSIKTVFNKQKAKL